MNKKNLLKVACFLGALNFVSCANLTVSAMKGVNHEKSKNITLNCINLESAEKSFKETFFNAIKSNDICKVKEMIASKREIVNSSFECKVEFANFEQNIMNIKYTSLEWAVQNRNLDIVKILVENGAKLYSDVSELTSLQLAAWNRDLDIFSYLLSNKNKNDKCKNDKYESCFEYWNFNYNLFYILGIVDSDKNASNSIDMLKVLINEYKKTLAPKDFKRVLTNGLQTAFGLEKENTVVMKECQKILLEELNN